DYAIELGGSYCNLGDLVQENGRPTESLDWYGKAVATLGAVLEKEPRLATARRFLSNSHSGRAQSLDQLARPAEAVKDWQRAVELDDQKRPALRLGHAAAQARTGQAAPAVSVAEEQAQAPNVTGATLFDCARVLALAAAAAKEDAALREQHAARAVALLRQA